MLKHVFIKVTFAKREGAHLTGTISTWKCHKWGGVGVVSLNKLKLSLSLFCPVSNQSVLVSKLALKWLYLWHFRVLKVGLTLQVMGGGICPSLQENAYHSRFWGSGDPKLFLKFPLNQYIRGGIGFWQVRGLLEALEPTFQSLVCIFGYKYLIFWTF